MQIPTWPLFENKGKITITIIFSSSSSFPPWMSFWLKERRWLAGVNAWTLRELLHVWEESPNRDTGKERKQDKTCSAVSSAQVLAQTLPKDHVTNVFFLMEPRAVYMLCVYSTTELYLHQRLNLLICWVGMHNSCFMLLKRWADKNKCSSCGLGDGSVGKTWEPEFESPVPTWKAEQTNVHL